MPLLIAGITIIVAAILAFVALMYVQFYYAIRSSTLDSANDRLTIAAEKTDSFLVKAENVVSVTANTIEYMIAKGDSNEHILDYLISETDSHLDTLDTNFTGIYGYYRGEYLDGNRWDPWADGGEYDPKVRPWYTEAIEANGEVTIASPYLDMDTGNIVLSVVKMLSDGESVCGMDVSLTEVSEYSGDLLLYVSGLSYIIDNNGFIVSAANKSECAKNYLSGDEEEFPGLKAAFEKALTSDREFNATVDGKDRLVFSKTITDNWNAILLTDPSEVFDFMSSTAGYLLVMLLIIFALLLYFALRIIREKRRESEIIRQERKHISIIRSLSGEYEVIYYVDLGNNRFDTFESNIDSDRKGTENLHFDRNFFTESRNSIDKLIYPADQPHVRSQFTKENILRNTEDGKEYRFSFRMMIGDSPEYCEMRCVRSSVEGEKDKLIVGVHNINDVVMQQQEHAQQLREALDKAQASDRSKTAFLFNMSHDIRTPMNAIIGFTDMAKKHIDDREKVVDCLEKVSVSGNHLLSLINDVLDMARIESGKMEINEVPVNLRETSKAVLTIAESDGRRKGLTVITDGGSAWDHTVYADPLRLNQVAMNIISNAVKYTPEGGTVRITAKDVPAKKKDRIGVDFIVEDTGIGMSEEFIKTVFVPFERAQTSTVSGIQGTGLGMSIVKSLVDKMGASISVESKPGVGTKITVHYEFLPAVDESGTEPDLNDSASAADAADAAYLSGKKVLLVEDNELNREIARDILEELGLNVDEAEDGTVAVQKCAEYIGKGAGFYPDFILMDIQMPKMDGYTATAEIRKLPDPLNLHVPIIAMTANAFAEDRQHALEAGMDAHLAKPIDPAQLTRTLASFVRG